MFKFISFGSGSSGNCYYLYTENGGILIDVGVGTRKLKNHFGDYGLNYFNGIKAILVTHDHADHIKSVGSISKKFDIPVYATRPVHSGMDSNVCMRSKITHDRRMYVEPGVSFTIGDFRITPFAVPHNSTDNAGYTIEHDGVVFSLLTDVGHITEEIASVIKRTNYLVIEANYDPQMLEVGPYPYYLKERIRSGNGHLSNPLCGEALVSNYTDNLRHIWLCHLSKENNKPEIALQCVVGTLENAGIKTGESLPVEALRRKLPTGIFDLE